MPYFENRIRIRPKHPDSDPVPGASWKHFQLPVPQVQSRGSLMSRGNEIRWKVKHWYQLTCAQLWMYFYMYISYIQFYKECDPKNSSSSGTFLGLIGFELFFFLKALKLKVSASASLSILYVREVLTAIISSGLLQKMGPDFFDIQYKGHVCQLSYSYCQSITLK